MGNKYRKKPVVIEAVQVTPEMIRDFGPFPNWSLPHLSAEKTEKINGSEAVFVRTLEGDMRVSPNDWLIRGVKGDVYPCKPDIFAATYEDANPVAAEERVGLLEDARNAIVSFMFEPRDGSYDYCRGCEKTGSWLTHESHAATGCEGAALITRIDAALAKEALRATARGS
ncbi:MAG: hypothetical protein IPH13_20210 [Planctomycetes bacterium]|nr:hypothetical protein [Planctomycetota bacterium]